MLLNVIEKGQNDLKWERISPFGQAPGAMTNISLAGANGMIYVFGSSEGKSVLWVFNTSNGGLKWQGF